MNEKRGIDWHLVVLLSALGVFAGCGMVAMSAAEGNIGKVILSIMAIVWAICMGIFLAWGKGDVKRAPIVTSHRHETAPPTVDGYYSDKQFIDGKWYDKNGGAL